MGSEINEAGPKSPLVSCATNWFPSDCTKDVPAQEGQSIVHPMPSAEVPVVPTSLKFSEKTVIVCACNETPRKSKTNEKKHLKKEVISRLVYRIIRTNLLQYFDLIPQ